jgi:kynurenine formamidase
MRSPPSPLSKGALASIAALHEPHVYDLGMPIWEAMPQWPASGARGFARSWTVAPRARGGSGELTWAVEAIEGCLHTSTHIDAVVHVQFDGLIHGGEPVGTAAADGFFARGGIATVAPIVAPFVLLDVAGARGVPALADDIEVGPDDLQRALAQTGLTIDPGTTVLIRTGKIQSFSAGDAYLEAQPGLSVSGAEWLADKQVTLIGSDTAGTERLPMPEVTGPVHKLLLFERGIHLVENLDLEQLAALERRCGVFVCLPLKLEGATASWVRPIAIA